MKELREKMKKARKHLKYGEIKMMADSFNLELDRAYPIARGRLTPYDNELQFCEELLKLARPRIQLVEML